RPLHPPEPEPVDEMDDDRRRDQHRAGNHQLRVNEKTRQRIKHLKFSICIFQFAIESTATRNNPVAYIPGSPLFSLFSPSSSLFNSRSSRLPHPHAMTQIMREHGVQMLARADRLEVDRVFRAVPAQL